MKKGISDAAFLPVWELDEFLFSAKNAGFEGVELNIRQNEGALTLNSSLKDAELIAQKCNELNLEVPSLSTILHNEYPLTSDKAAVRNHGKEIALKMIELAEGVGAKIVQIVPGVPTPGVYYENAYEMSQEILSELSIEAKRRGIIIGVENVCNKFLPSPMEFRHFLDEINSYSVKAYLDIGNAIANGYLEHWIPLLGNRIVSIHAKDYKLDSNEFVHYPGGDINWFTVIELLHKINYQGYVMSTPPPPYNYCQNQLMKDASNDLTKFLV